MVLEESWEGFVKVGDLFSAEVVSGSIFPWIRRLARHIGWRADAPDEGPLVAAAHIDFHAPVPLFVS